MSGPEHDEVAKAGTTVFIVDDHAMVATALAQALETHPGLRVLGSAGDAADGLAAIDELGPEIVIMDYHLPSSDGIVCAAEVLARHPATRILLISGEEHQGVVARAVSVGCRGFLRKSASLEDMIAAVTAVASGELAFASRDLIEALQPATPQIGSDLSERELDVLRHLVAGDSTRRIAEQLFISEHTVRTHVRHILEKLGAHSKLEAVSVALRQGIVAAPNPEPDPHHR